MDQQLSLDGSQVTLEGTVERILHSNEETGWSVLLFDGEGEGRMRTVGSFLGVLEGDRLRLRGDWVEHPKFGRQLKTASFTPVKPATLEGIERYLAGFVDGIDAKLASRIVETFGDQTLAIFEDSPARLIEVRGIGKKRREQILEAFDDTQKIRDSMVLLQGYGLSAALAARIYKRFGENTARVIHDNPYRLTEVRGIGFQRADALAQAKGMAPDAPERIAAGTIYNLEEASNQGHMFLRRPELRARTSRLLRVHGDLVDTATETELSSGRLQAVEEAIYLRRLEAAERQVATRLLALLKETVAPLRVKIEVAVGSFESQERIQLAEAQRNALREMVESKVMVLTGGPGTGKTTLTKGIVYVANLAGLEVRLAAPTGRAAKRLHEATGVEAKTIHRLLGYQPDNTFKYNEENLLEVDLLVVDETSMLDTPLARHLLMALPETTRLILVGDVDQLPSVGPGRVLGDLIDSGKIPLIRLTEIFRQAQKSLIVVNAHRIIHGELPIRGQDDTADFFVAHREDPAKALDEIEDLVARRIPAKFGYVPIRDIQVLAPTRRGPLGIENINARLQAALNDAPEAPSWSRRRFRQGDRVMQTSNNYDLEVFNGEIGRVHSFDSDEKEVMVELDDRLVGYPVAQLEELELAYAVTIHKAQGSEFPCVVIVLHSQHYVMLQRNLFYTAVTRGKRLVIVVGARRALETATRTETTQRRETLLVERLQESNNP